MIIVNPLLPVPFPIPSLFSTITGVNGLDSEMDGPVSVSISSKKVIQTTRTVGGYVHSHWGEEPDIMNAKGSVILMTGREGLGFLSLLILKTLYRLDKKKIDGIFKAVSRYVATGAFMASAIGELYSRKLAINNALYKSGGITAGISLAAETALKTLSIYQANKDMTQQLEQNPDLSVTYIYHDNYIYRGFFTSFNYTRDANNPRFINYTFSFTIDWNTENYLADQLLKTTNGKTVTAFGL